MDHHIKDFFSPRDDALNGNFNKAISLNAELGMSWEDVVKLAPDIPRGWYELSRLNVPDRIEFTRDYCLSKMPYHRNLDDFITRFFDSIDDVYVYIIQKKIDHPFEAQLVYSLKDDKGFFRGGTPAKESDIQMLKSQFEGIIFPEDYLTFLQIHDGFWKTTDCTGLIFTKNLKKNYDLFQSMLSQEEAITTDSGTQLDPMRLIPFYESFGMPFYQCFWADWYPEQEMGNVYFSGVTKTISDVKGKGSSAESMSFPSFTDWLMFYMELIA